MSNNVYIKQTLVSNESFDELDFQLHREFGFDYDTHDDFVTIQEGQGYVDNAMMKIEQLEEVLKSMKEKGATHISLDYHCDHIGYDMSGYKIEAATQDEIDVFTGKKKAKKQEAKQARIAQLQEEIKRLQEE
jgi:hypothetical protein